jgi:outer membrane protein TolC
MTRPPFMFRRGAALSVAAAVVVVLAGCADMSGIASQAKLRDADSLGLKAAPFSTGTSEVDARWWLGFGDAQLDALVDEALAGSPNIAVARARLSRAQAAIATAESADRPQLNGSLDATRQKFSSNYIYPAPLAGSIQEVGTLQLNGSWEIDFFGKNRAALDSALGSSNAAAAEVDAARILLASNVARGYIQWARLNDQLTVARRTLAQRGETLQLVRDRVSAGLDTRLELRQSEGGLPEARQQIEALDEQIAIAQHALDALVLGRRADIAAARWRVEAATGEVAGAKTQFYPNVNLTAFVGVQSLGFDNLLKSDSAQWGVGPAIRLPIFEGGRLRANLRGKAADLDAAIESYNASVLDALRDAADQVSSAQSVTRQQAQQREAQTAAEGAYDIAVQRYRAGLGNYLNVLTAESTVLAQRRQAVDLAARALETQVGLARALGGGWQPPVAVADTGKTAITH